MGNFFANTKFTDKMAGRGKLENEVINELVNVFNLFF
jgi:hypothetical protein